LDAVRLRKVLALLQSAEDSEAFTPDSMELVRQARLTGKAAGIMGNPEAPSEARGKMRTLERLEQFQQVLSEGDAGDAPFAWETKWRDRYRRWGSYDDFDKVRRRVRDIDPAGYKRLVYRATPVTVNGEKYLRLNLDYDRWRQPVPLSDPALELWASLMPNEIRVPWRWHERDLSEEQRAAWQSVRQHGDKAAFDERNRFLLHRMLAGASFSELAAETDMSEKTLRKNEQLELLQHARKGLLRFYARAFRRLGLPASEIAELLNVSTDKVQRLTRSESIPHKQLWALRALHIAAMDEYPDGSAFFQWLISPESGIGPKLRRAA
jgi:hypothetical protein